MIKTTDSAARLLLDAFYRVSQIPRATGCEQAIGAYLTRLARTNSCTAETDQAGNILICRPGGKTRTLLLQGHLDMVCVKEPDSPQDFAKDPIPIRMRDGWLYANGTTLGADNGLAIAMCICLIEQTVEPSDPTLKFLLTTGEECGMTGAFALGFSAQELAADAMINLDAGWDCKLVDASAGSCTACIRLPLQRKACVPGRIYAELCLSGLPGGHSGLRIHDSPGNAILLLHALLERSGCTPKQLGLLEMHSPGPENTIPAQARVLLACEPTILPSLERARVSLLRDLLLAAPQAQLTIRELSKQAISSNMPLTRRSVQALDQLLSIVPNGVIRYQDKAKRLPYTSNNLGLVELDADYAVLRYQLRSFDANELRQLLTQMDATAEECGAQLQHSICTPPWHCSESSAIREIVSSAWNRVSGQTPALLQIHASLECAILTEKLGGIDCICMGSEIQNAHTTAERAEVASFVRAYSVLVDTINHF